MYIDQINTKNFNPYLYLPVPLFFFGLLIVNFVASSGVNTEEILQMYIEKIGVNATFVLMILPLSVACILLLFWVHFAHGQSLVSLVTSRKRIDWGRVFFSFGLWAFISIGLIGISYWMTPDNYIWNFSPLRFIVFFFLAILLIPLQTSFEELLFRGYFMQGIGVIAGNRWLPLILTSVCFGLMHISNPEVAKIGMPIMIYYIGTGFFLGIMTLMDEGVELALGFHAANNLIVALLVTADWTAFQTHSVLKDISEPSMNFEVVVPVFIIFPILLFIFGRKYGWSQWKEKLTGKVSRINS